MMHRFAHYLTWVKHCQIVAIVILLAPYLEPLSQLLALGATQ